jgi:hypothetical protein
MGFADDTERGTSGSNEFIQDARASICFQRGYLANSMLVTKEPNNTGLTGVHHIYVNSIGD